MYRAVTHNKGIANGIDPVVVATGNDWRAVEAAARRLRGARRDVRPARDLAARRRRRGAGRPLLEVPLALGVVGGAPRAHRGARLALQLEGTRSAAELSMVAAAAGLANNLAAPCAMATEGIQRAGTWRSSCTASPTARTGVDQSARGHGPLLGHGGSPRKGRPEARTEAEAVRSVRSEPAQFGPNGRGAAERVRPRTCSPGGRASRGGRRWRGVGAWWPAPPMMEPAEPWSRPEAGVELGHGLVVSPVDEEHRLGGRRPGRWADLALAGPATRAAAGSRGSMMPTSRACWRSRRGWLAQSSKSAGAARAATPTISAGVGGAHGDGQAPPAPKPASQVFDLGLGPRLGQPGGDAGAPAEREVALGLRPPRAGAGPGRSTRGWC